MSHSCQDCGELCFCNGDIGDMELNTDETYLACIHCPDLCGEDCNCEFKEKEEPKYNPDMYMD